MLWRALKCGVRQRPQRRCAGAALMAPGWPAQGAAHARASACRPCCGVSAVRLPSRGTPAAPRMRFASGGPKGCPFGLPLSEGRSSQQHRTGTGACGRLKGGRPGSHRGRDHGAALTLNSAMQLRSAGIALATLGCVGALARQWRLASKMCLAKLLLPTLQHRARNARLCWRFC